MLWIGSLLCQDLRNGKNQACANKAVYETDFFIEVLCIYNLEYVGARVGARSYAKACNTSELYTSGLKSKRVSGTQACIRDNSKVDAT